MKLPVAVVLLVGLFGLEAGRYAQGSQEWIKFETIDQSALPIVRSRLNGMGPHRLVIDVSFKKLALDTVIVEGSGMKLASRGEKEEIDYYGKKEKVPVAYLQTLELGGAKFQLVRTLLIEGEGCYRGGRPSKLRPHRSRRAGASSLDGALPAAPIVARAFPERSPTRRGDLHVGRPVSSDPRSSRA